MYNQLFFTTKVRVITDPLFIKHFDFYLKKKKEFRSTDKYKKVKILSNAITHK